MQPRSKRPGTISRDAAEAVGLKALLFVTEDEGRLFRFLTESGMDPAELRRQAATVELQAALLAHLLEDESMLLVFAAGAGLDPAEVQAARIALGGSQPWDST